MRFKARGETKLARTWPTRQRAMTRYCRTKRMERVRSRRADTPGAAIADDILMATYKKLSRDTRKGDEFYWRPGRDQETDNSM